MKIFNYVEASDFEDWVSNIFGVKNVRSRLLEWDYIEGRLGSRWTLGYIDKENPDITEWFNDFLLDNDLTEIELKY